MCVFKEFFLCYIIMCNCQFRNAADRLTLLPLLPCV